jgi:uncharacterized membrane protein
MKNLLGILKATAVGGFVFLVPLVIVFAILAKAIELMMLLAKPFEAWVPLDSSSGLLTANVLSLMALLLLCLVAGLVARSGLGRRVATGLDSWLGTALPGYGFVKGFTESLARSDEASRSFAPVVARFDDNAQIAFEVERTGSGQVVVYLPGAPNPWGGSVVYMSADRIEPLDLSMTDAIRNIQRLGRGSAGYASPA